MASTAVTVQDMFSGGMANIKDTASKAVIKPKRQLPTRDSQGKFVERNTGLLLTALGKIYGTLNKLVALTQESLNIEKKDQVVERAAQMRLSLGRAETDPPGEKKDEKGPGFMDSLKAGWGKIKKPFEGMGTKIMLAGLLGLIVLLGKFKDNLVEPLAKIFVWMDTTMTEDISAFYTKVKGWWFTGWEAVKSFFTMMGDMFTSIKDWVDSFDVNEQAGLQKEELEELRKEAAKKVGEFVKDSILAAFGTFFSGLGLAAGVATAASILGLGPLKLALGLGTKAAGVPGSAAVAASSLGVVGSLAIGLIVANSIFKTYKKMAIAMDKAGEDGSFDTGKFVGAFFGGDAKGSWGNAFSEAKTWGQMLAGPGALIGLSVAGPPGALVGGAIGFLIGAVIGGIGGLLGADKIEAFVNIFVDDLKLAKESIGAFFEGIINGVEALFSDEKTFAEAFVGTKLRRATGILTIYEDLYAKMDAESEEAKKYLAETLAPQRAKVAMLTKQFESATTSAAETEEVQGLRKDVSDVEVQQGAALVNIEKEQQWFLDNPNAFKGGQLYKDAEKRLADAQNTYNDVTKRLGILQGKLYTAGADIPTGAVIAPAASETLKLAQVRAQEVAAFKSQRENALGALQTNIGGIKGGDQNVAVSNEHYHGRYEDYHTNFTAATLGSANKGLNISIALPFGKG